MGIRPTSRLRKRWPASLHNKRAIEFGYAILSRMAGLRVVRRPSCLIGIASFLWLAAVCATSPDDRAKGPVDRRSRNDRGRIGPNTLPAQRSGGRFRPIARLE